MSSVANPYMTSSPSVRRSFARARARYVSASGGPGHASLRRLTSVARSPNDPSRWIGGRPGVAARSPPPPPRRPSHVASRARQRRRRVATSLLPLIFINSGTRGHYLRPITAHYPAAPSTYASPFSVISSPVGTRVRAAYRTISILASFSFPPTFPLVLFFFFPFLFRRSRGLPFASFGDETWTTRHFSRTATVLPFLRILAPTVSSLSLLSYFIFSPLLERKIFSLPRDGEIDLSF